MTLMMMIGNNNNTYLHNAGDGKGADKKSENCEKKKKPNHSAEA